MTRYQIETDLRSHGLLYLSTTLSPSTPVRSKITDQISNVQQREVYIYKTGQLARHCVGLGEPGEESDEIFILCTTYQPSRLCSLCKSFSERTIKWSRAILECSCNSLYSQKYIGAI